MAEIQIQGQTISQRPEKSQLDGTEALLLQDAEGTKHAKASTIKTFVQPDLSGYAKKTEIPSTEGFLSAEEAAETYQPKGNYLTEVPDEYVTETEQQQALQDYAKKTELGNKLDVSTYNSDKATFATKAELNDKVSGTGVTSIQVVTELPSEQQDGVLYIVQEQESEEETA